GAEGAAAAPAGDPRIALAGPREEALPALLGAALEPLGAGVLGALPPPPDKVVLDPGYYGAVTVDHRAHLARRVSCVRCHGPGPVHKIGRMPPARAHESCRGCHEELARGPTECRGCHVAKVAPPDTAVAAAGPLAPGGEAAGSVAPPAAPGATSSGRAAPELEPGHAGGPDADDLSDHLALRTSVHAGTTMLVAPGVGSAEAGLLVGVTLRGEGYLCSQTLEWAGITGGRGRAVGLLGGGFLLPVSRRADATLELIGGFDAREGSFADLVPALGARAGLQWIGGRRWADTVRLSVTALADVSRGHDPPASQIGSFTVSAALAVGVDVSKLR
ncbi:cytochrome c3 family protein, partial [Anaeromyxobacter oryzisoli]|uniref:cytochrome c3 family protein n=1 Tax=Anaeromyxobacter oryzisoli TaxID=2925408 RepID=UPI001F5782B6